MTGRDAARVALVEAYARAQGVFASTDSTNVQYSKVISVQLSGFVPTLAGPRRPHDRVPLREVKQSWTKTLPNS